MVFHRKSNQSKVQGNKISYGKDQKASFKPDGNDTDPQEYKGKDGLAGTDGYVVDKK